MITNILFYCKRPFSCLEAVDCRLGWLVAVVMADIIEPMCCEVVCSLDGGETDFLVVCVCVCGMTVDHGILFLFRYIFGVYLQ